MTLKICFSLLCVGISSLTVAQEISMEQHREDLKNMMINYIETSQAQLTSELDSIRENGDATLEGDAVDIQILRRLKGISKTIPLEYNSSVRSYIDKYTSQNYRPYMNRLKGLSQHYFSIYDRILQGAGIPTEIKYLSLVESSLNPHLVSTSGAVGPWQFMYATAKSYDLDMNQYIDERKDAYASTVAVARYLNEAYTQFGDWLLALASYNCGRGCVQRAIQRSGLHNPSFWELSSFLPKETRNYIPKYIAMTYVMELADFYAIYPSDTELDLACKEVMVDKQVNLHQISKAINLSTEDLKKYNPSYKKSVINGSVDSPKRLLVPQTSTINDTLLYAALSGSDIERGLLEDNMLIAQLNVPSSYQVGRGESIYDVSRKFGVSVQNLRAWNSLGTRTSLVGKTLLLNKPLEEKIAKNVAKSIKNKNTSKTVYYTVKSGDSLDRIANRYKGVSVSKLKADNNLKSTVIRPGMKLKIHQS